MMVDTTHRRTIGGKASEFDGIQWIRGFKEGETQLRILEPASDWWKFPEHYSADLGYFACNSPSKDPDPTECIGCAHPSERVQNRSFKYAFNAIDKDGKVRVFKLGGKIRKTLRQREQSISKDVLQLRDIVIIRTGTGFGGENGTEYSYEWGETYEPDGGLQQFVDQSNDVGEAVTTSYWEAVRKLDELDGDPDDAADHEVPDEEGDQAKTPPAKKMAAKKTTPAKKTASPTRTRLGGKPESEPQVADVTPDEPGPDGESGEVIEVTEEVVASIVDRMRDMETEDIRDHLKNFAPDVEVPPRCPRPRLIALAEQALIDGKLPPF